MGAVRGRVTTAPEPPALGVPGRLVDRIFASDPGLVRLQMAVRTTVALGSALGVEALFRGMTGGGAMTRLVALLLGAVVAMMGAMGLSSGSTGERLRTGAFMPVAVGAGLTLGAAVRGHRTTMLAVFVAVMFVAVAIRRFGIPFFFYGFMAWMGYFLASFLGISFGALPGLLEDAAVAVAWVLLLSVTVLRGHPGRDLRRALRAFGARSRAVAEAAADELAAPRAGRLPDARGGLRGRRLQRRATRLAEAALMVEAQLGTPGAVPPGWSAGLLRSRLLDLELAIDELTRTAVLLAGSPDLGLRGSAAAVLRALATRDLDGAETAAGALAASPAAATGPDEDRHAAQRLAAAAIEYVALARAWVAIDRAAPPGRRAASGPPDEEEFEPAVALMMGNLPSSARTAADVTPRGAAWNPLTRLSQTTRQAVQVALSGGLAIVAGEALSTRRYYWAVIAAFVTFTGTATRAETVRKASNRVLGTLAGLVVSLVLAHATSGHPGAVVAVILGCVFCGFYLQRVSYAYMIFFITIMIGQLYAMLHELTAELLLLRLEETALGACCGIAVGLVFVPVSTRDTARAARGAFYTALAELLGSGGGDGARDPDDAADADGLARSLDVQLHQLVQITGPLSGPFGLGPDSARLRHRMALYTALAGHARALVPDLRARPERPSQRATDPVLACLAAAARAQAGVPPATADTDAALRSAQETLARCADADVDAARLRTLTHLHGTMRALLADQDGVPARGATASASA